MEGTITRVLESPDPSPPHCSIALVRVASFFVKYTLTSYIIVGNQVNAPVFYRSTVIYLTGSRLMRYMQTRVSPLSLIVPRLCYQSNL